MEALKFIATFLGLTQRNNSINPSTPEASTLHNGNVDSTTSCKGWSRPDPDVRLRLSDSGTIRMFGFPAARDLPAGMELPLRRFGNPGPPLLYLQDNVPAYVEYVMGNDWEIMLQDHQPADNGYAYSEGKAILRPNDTAADDVLLPEKSHCVRMRRCGAVAVRSGPDIGASELDDQRLPDQLFGWPSSGGVWILRLPEFNPDDFAGQNYSTSKMMELRQKEMRFRQVIEGLCEQADMDDLCRYLQKAGAHFYAAPNDCPEVLELGLIDG